MHWRVGRQRHHPVLHFVTDLSQLSILSIGRELAPFRKIQNAPAVVDMIRQPPRDGRDVRVPRPHRFVCMTVATRTIENRCDLRRHLREGIDRLRFIDGRIRAHRSHDLNSQEGNNQYDSRDLEKVFEQSHGANQFSQVSPSFV